MQTSPSQSIALAFAILSMGVVGCSAKPDRTTPVGRTTMVTTDASRPAWGQDGPRPIVVTIWYPAASGVVESEWQIGIFKAGWTSVDAEIAAAPQRRPLVLLSHGTGGAALQLSWLAESLATNGYVVAAVNHHGNTAAEATYQPQGFFLWWERAKDISVAIDTVLADPRFARQVDPERIGVAGFSLGGFTAVLSAGAMVDRSQWQAFCEQNPRAPTCTLPPEATFSRDDIDRLIASDTAVVASMARAAEPHRDSRVRASYAIAPVLVPSLTVASLASVDVPVRIVVGAADQQAVPSVNARPLQRGIPSATLWELPDVGHYTFLANCTLRGRWFVGTLCKDASGVDRRDVHATVATDVIDFFNEHLAVNGRSQDR